MSERFWPSCTDVTVNIRYRHTRRIMTWELRYKINSSLARLVLRGSMKCENNLKIRSNLAILPQYQWTRVSHASVCHVRHVHIRRSSSETDETRGANKSNGCRYPPTKVNKKSTVTYILLLFTALYQLYCTPLRRCLIGSHETNDKTTDAVLCYGEGILRQ